MEVLRDRHGLDHHPSSTYTGNPADWSMGSQRPAPGPGFSGLQSLIPPPPDRPGRIGPDLPDLAGKLDRPCRAALPFAQRLPLTECGPAPCVRQ